MFQYNARNAPLALEELLAAAEAAAAAGPPQAAAGDAGDEMGA